MPLLDTWGFFRPRHPFWVDTPTSQCTPLGRAGVTEAQPPFRGCPSPAPSSAAPGLSRQHCSGRLDPTATGKDTSSPPLSPEVDVSSPEGAVRAERAWRLSPWTEASPVPGLARGGDETVCGELRHLEGGTTACPLPKLPGSCSAHTDLFAQLCSQSQGPLQGLRKLGFWSLSVKPRA